ncbi:DUF4112 domain-containing protein [Cerasicoccus fimbriatus]|uniref:DUF4112 domain-containing protein n=1 Tax=Cerasicoccus fimbriatus TaxID=3014554 RepID=UPI0022B4214C|nr:DUF4112 domain-containing protein [Cerasicoccus sp. TK19100]
MLQQTRSLQRSSQSNEKASPKSRASRVVANIMDDCIRIPGTDWRIGLDPIIGLIPGWGDSAGAAAGGVILWAGLREGLPTIALMRMGVNVVINTVFGAIPVLGDLFSAWFKSNRRNYDILQKHIGQKRRPKAIDYGVVIGFAVIVVAMLAAIIWFSLELINAALTMLGF